MSSRIGCLFIILIIFSFTGCVTKHKTLITLEKENYSLQQADEKLIEVATSINRSLQELARIHRAIQPKAALPQPMNPNTIGMGQLSSIDWNGPIEPIVKKLAAASGYKLKVLGVVPSIPIIISITAVDTPLGDILRDIQFQAGSKAEIIVYPGLRVIELRYIREARISK